MGKQTFYTYQDKRRPQYIVMLNSSGDFSIFAKDVAVAANAATLKVKVGVDSLVGEITIKLKCKKFICSGK